MAAETDTYDLADHLRIVSDTRLGEETHYVLWAGGKVSENYKNYNSAWLFDQGWMACAKEEPFENWRPEPWIDGFQACDALKNPVTPVGGFGTIDGGDC